MHPLHDRISALLHAHLATKRIVVWYDPRKEFEPYFTELLDGKNTGEALVPVKFKKLKVHRGYKGNKARVKRRLKLWYKKVKPTQNARPCKEGRRDSPRK